MRRCPAATTDVVASVVLLVMLREGAAPTVVPSSTAAHRQQKPVTPLACGGTGDPAADSTSVLALFAFAKTACCDQLGEGCWGGGYLPTTCKTAGCAHVIDIVSSACAPPDGGGAWTDGFLGVAFGPMLDPVRKMCQNSDAEHMEERDHTYAIADHAVDEPINCNSEEGAGLGASLPIYIVDGEYEEDGGVDCHTCGLNTVGEDFCKDRCTEGATPVAAASSGELCGPDHHPPDQRNDNAACATNAFCNMAFADEEGAAKGVEPRCQACADCAPKPVGGNQYDSLSVVGPTGQELRVTVALLYLPEGASLQIFPNRTAHPEDQITLTGQQLPDPPVIVTSGGSVEVRLHGGGPATAAKPASFRLEVDAVCRVHPKTAAERDACNQPHGYCCGVSADHPDGDLDNCGATDVGVCVCRGGFSGASCQFPPF